MLQCGDTLDNPWSSVLPVSGEVGGDFPGGRRDGANLQDNIGSTLNQLLFQSFICSMADLMKRPKALSFFRLSTYDISWYSDSFLSFI